MSANLGGNVRTIWITLRAVNYTQKVFTDINNMLKATQKSEESMIDTTNRMSKAATDFISAGMMMVSLGAMIGMQMWNLAATSKEGATDFAQLTNNLNATKSALADTFYEFLKASQILNLVNGILTFIRDNKWAQYLVLGLGLAAVALLLVVGSLFLFNGAILQASMFGKTFGILCDFMTEHEITLFGATVSLSTAMMGLAVSAGAGFAIFFALQGVLGNLPAAIIAVGAAVLILAAALWGAAIPMSILTFGVAAIAAGAAIGGLMASGVIPKYQMGTRTVPYTGPIMAHQGEVIYNPSTNRPLQVGNDMAREGAGPQASETNIVMNVAQMNTKAEVDNVDEEMRKAWRRSIRGRK